ncbi:MAG: bifunctional oligoribonuclease/PAP phosphatase NrnA [Planctomycetes bacterium]|nr:bifunctional oligoribonuclease/PAP phosphatase NrnA [Planctomycetota bacterium]
MPDATDQVQKTLEAIIDRLNRWKQPVIVGHVVPDADCLGSMLAIARAWAGNGVVPRVALPDGCVSQRLGFMVEAAQIPVATAEDFANADGFVAVDTAKKSRCNVGPHTPESWADGRELINIDHHSTNTRFGELNWIVDTASSAAEMAHGLIRHSGRNIDSTVAMLLYCGIHADTGGFSLPMTSPNTLEAGAHLVKCGANVPLIGEQLCRSQRLNEFNLLRTIYANTRLVADGRIAYSTASYDEITGAGCAAADIDDQVGVPRSLQGIRIAMLFSEGNPGKIRINFRGEGGLDVLSLAQQVGGGGHRESAGAVAEGSLEEVVKRVVAMATDYIDKECSTV